jgi:hypothetical protein
VTRAEVIALMAQLKARPREREQARRMWLQGIPRKQIARQLGVSHHTVKHWRYHHQWPARVGNHVEHRIPEEQPVPRLDTPICFVCAAPSTSWDGHSQCRGRT